MISVPLPSETTSRPLRALSLALLLAALAACGGQSGSNASQVAARVNDGEITVHQVNHLLRTARGVTEANVGEARQRILEQLIQQELLVQQAQAQKLERDPQVLQQLEAARREILARAYVERAVAAAPKPDGQAVRAYFSEHPELFRERRVFRFNEFRLSGLPDDGGALLASLREATDLRDAVERVRKAGGDVVVTSNIARPIETLPMTTHDALARAKVGSILVYQAGGLTTVAEVRHIAPAPVDEAQALPAIERLLEGRERQSLALADIKRLREAATIAYLGDFGPPKGAGDAAAAASPAGAAGGEPEARPAPADPALVADPVSTATPAAAAGAPSGLSQGIKGLR